MLGEKTSPITLPSKKASNPRPSRRGGYCFELSLGHGVDGKLGGLLFAHGYTTTPRKLTWIPTIHGVEDVFSFRKMGFSGSNVSFRPPTQVCSDLVFFTLGDDNPQVYHLADFQ